MVLVEAVEVVGEYGCDDWLEVTIPLAVEEVSPELAEVADD